MRCRFCAEAAGWLRRRCRDCRRLEEVYRRHCGADMATMMELFMVSGAPRAKVERFLDSDLRGTGAIRDQIAADMTNQLLEALGRPGRQTAGEVKRIRERGAWVHLDRRPPE